MTRTRLATLLLAAATAVVDAGGTPPAVPGPPPLPADRVDRAVYRRLRALNIVPAPLSRDGVFLRRVYLDVIGTLPTAKEVQAFLEDRSPNKRRTVIDRLLARPEFADFWAMKWSDLLRVKSEFPINLWPNAAHAYYQWIRASLRANMPYDRFMRHLVTSSGSNFRVPPVNFYRALVGRKPETLARTVALTFMGVRAERWPAERLAGMAGFFAFVGFKGTAEWKEEIVYFDTVGAAKALASGRFTTPRFPDGRSHRLSPFADPRVAFADWLLEKDNPWFATNIVNRIWCWLQGRGIVHPPDDIRPDNPPINPELLAVLAGELVSSKYDLKHIFRTILNSRVYQASCLSPQRSPVGEANFACYAVRRLEAEVLIDAICRITHTGESYSSMIPEPFTFIPGKSRTIRLPDGSITSPFLDMFGRPPRDTGMVEERGAKPSAAQRLHLLNSSHIRRKIERGGGIRALSRRAKGHMRRTVELLYLTILSRYPTAEEWLILMDTFKGNRRMTWTLTMDLAWALINTMEFQYRH